MNEKNRLVEYCQFHQMELPIYDSWKDELGWYSTVYIYYGNMEFRAKNQEAQINKTFAERKAASRMIDKITYYSQCFQELYQSKEIPLEKEASSETDHLMENQVNYGSIDQGILMNSIFNRD